ncbi:hypothetical protein HN873_053354 [Arachis hypogaea]|uniref:AT-hook motif nuclear-localized protein n=1 Tax=Arachis hypogaea TaxID=3818 RepID=A0A444YY30_ARAHY|nr:AT-hook motif nuclear-localized protein [Arachis hypogaea]RYR06841.1 hypothetical protein Ahy_B05g074161 [Arachis hypogaea]
MEKEDIFGSGHAVKADEAPGGFHVAPRSENIQFSAPTAEPPQQPVVPATAMVAVTPATGTDGKKKRGRPRKYGPDGKLTPEAAAKALSPMPISASIPLTGEFSGWKKGRGKAVESMKKSYKFFEFENAGGPGNGIAYSVGANITPHILTVNAGEDVTMKIMSFSQDGSRAICILSANGTISNVTLRQPTSSGGTLTYEGRFEILSLSGSYMPTENGFTRSRSGGMSVSLAGPDGRVMGGGLAGLLVAAGPVQVVVGSFIPGHQLEHKQKKQRVEHHISSTISAPLNVPTISAEEMKITLGGVKPFMTPPSVPFQVENIPPPPPAFVNGQCSLNSSGDDDDEEDASLHEKESNPSLSDPAGVAC